MAKVKINTSTLENAYGKFDSIITQIDSVAVRVRHEKKRIDPYSGYGVEMLDGKLNKIGNTLDTISNDLDEERKTLKKIIELARNCDNDVYKIFSGRSVQAYEVPNTSGNSKQTSKGNNTQKVTVTHSDFEKILKQFKYYSTRNDATARFYNYLSAFYNSNQNYEFSREEYDALKNTFMALTHQNDGGAYVYSKVSNFTTTGDVDIATSNGKILNASGEAVGKQIEYRRKYGGDTADLVIKIGTAAGSVDIGSELLGSLNEGKSKKLLEDLEKIKDLNSKDGQDKAKKAFANAGITINASVTAFEVSSVVTRKINETYSFYDKVTVTAGQLYGKANVTGAINRTGIEVSESVKFGAVLAKIDTEMGYITNDAKLAVKTGAKYGFEVGQETKFKIGEDKNFDGTVDAGFFSAGLNIDDGWGYYEWL